MHESAGMMQIANTTIATLDIKCSNKVQNSRFETLPVLLHKVTLLCGDHAFSMSRRLLQSLDLLLALLHRNLVADAQIDVVRLELSP